MRRSDRELLGKEKQKEILDSCKVCRVALQDKDELYIVPLNFGYCWEEEYPVLYFHSAGEGRKISMISGEPRVCIEMDCGHALKEAGEACGYGFCYQSLIGWGKAEIVKETGEKKRALTLLMRQQTGKDFVFTDAMTESVTVFRIRLDRMTAKACR